MTDISFSESWIRLMPLGGRGLHQGPNGEISLLIQVLELATIPASLRTEPRASTENADPPGEQWARTGMLWHTPATDPCLDGRSMARLWQAALFRRVLPPLPQVNWGWRGCELACSLYFFQLHLLRNLN